MPTKQPLYDLSHLIAISRGNEQFVKKMVDEFCKQTPVQLTQLIVAYNSGEMETMGNLAHRMKPAIDTLRINQLRPVIRNIEKMGSGEMKGDGLQQNLNELEITIKRVVHLLQQDY